MNNYSSKNTSEQKYLKYKNKYLKFKQSGGKMHDSSNYYIYFCFNKEKTKVFIDALDDFTTLTIDRIDNDLTLGAIKYNFENKFSIVVAQGSNIKDGVLSINNIYIQEKIDIIKLMSKINLLILIKSLQDKFNSYQKNIQPIVPADATPDETPYTNPDATPDATPGTTPGTTPDTTPGTTPGALVSNATPQNVTQPVAGVSTTPPVTPVPIKTGGAPIGKIVISSVLLFEKVKDDMKMISHFKVEDDNIEDVSITEKFNIDYTENKESSKEESKKDKGRGFFFRKK